MIIKAGWMAAAVVMAGLAAQGGEVDLRKVGEWSSGISNMIHTLAVDANRLFVCHDSSGLFILDVADPTQPTLLSKYKCPDGALGVTVDGNTAYVGSGKAGLLVLDVSDPVNPKKLGGIDTSGMAFRSDLHGHTLYQADREGGLYIFDVSNPAQPVILGQKSVGDSVWDVKVSGSYAFLAGNAGLWVLNVSLPASPEIVTNDASLGGLRALSVVDETLYAGGYSGRLCAFDIRDPSAPTLTSKIGVSNGNPIFSVAATRARIATGWESGGGFTVLDREDPLAPRTVAMAWDRNLSVAVSTSAECVFVSDYHGLVTVFSAEPSPILSIRNLNLGRSENRALLAAGDGAIHIAQPSKMITWASTSELGYEATSTNAVSLYSVASPPQMATFGRLGVAAGAGREMVVFDLTEPYRPIHLASVALEHPSRVVASDGKYAVVAGGQSISVVDLTDPAAPSLTATVTNSQGYWGVALAGNCVYTGTQQTLAPSQSHPPVLQVFVLGDGGQPRLRFEQNAPGSICGLMATGDRLYTIQSRPASASIYSLEDPAAPVLLGSYANAPDYSQMVLLDGYLYARVYGQGFDILDVRDPRDIRRVGGNSLPIQSLITDGTLLYANSATDLYFFQPLVPPSENRLTPLGVMEGRFRFLLEGEAGQSVEVQRAATLGDWLPWQTLTLETNKLAVEDVLNPEQAAGFYRVLQK